jgi:hypothetical protein
MELHIIRAEPSCIHFSFDITKKMSERDIVFKFGSYDTHMHNYLHTEKFTKNNTCFVWFKKPQETGIYKLTMVCGYHTNSVNVVISPFVRICFYGQSLNVGSCGTIINYNNSICLLTNKHVIQNQDCQDKAMGIIEYPMKDCNIHYTFYLKDTTLVSDSPRFCHNGYDYVILKLNNTVIDNLKKLYICPMNFVGEPTDKQGVIINAPNNLFCYKKQNTLIEIEDINADIFEYKYICNPTSGGSSGAAIYGVNNGVIGIIGLHHGQCKGINNKKIK